MSGVNPQGCEVFSFKQPSAEELEHDFLWRTTRRLPERGRIGSSIIHERNYWKDYVNAYEACLQATSTHHTPWYIVPADDKENARLIVSRIVLDALEGLKMAYPEPPRSAGRNCSRSANSWRNKERAA